jgi:hypothetical protein
MIWPCKENGKNKDTEKEIRIKLKGKRPMGRPRKGWFSQILRKHQEEREEIGKERHWEDGRDW